MKNISIKTSSLAVAMGIGVSSMLWAGAAVAQPAGGEFGKVISVAPVVQQVNTPRQVCTTAQVAEPERRGGAGMVLGAIAGGAAGNAVGNGMGRAAATAAGLIGGALIGSAIEGTSAGGTRAVQNCTQQTAVENRTVAYNVVYEFNGKQYQTQMPNDPGQWVQLNIQPVVTGSSNRPAARAVQLPAPTYTTQVVPQALPHAVMPGSVVVPTGALESTPIQLPPVSYNAGYVADTVTTVYGQPVVVQHVQYVGVPYAVRPYYSPIALSVGYVHRGGHRHNGRTHRWH